MEVVEVISLSILNLLSFYLRQMASLMQNLISVVRGGSAVLGIDASVDLALLPAKRQTK